MPSRKVSREERVLRALFTMYDDGYNGSWVEQRQFSKRAILAAIRSALRPAAKRKKKGRVK